MKRFSKRKKEKNSTYPQLKVSNEKDVENCNCISTPKRNKTITLNVINQKRTTWLERKVSIWEEPVLK